MYKSAEMTAAHLQVAFGAIQTPEPGLDGSESPVHDLMRGHVGHVVLELGGGLGLVHRGHQPLPQRVATVTWRTSGSKLTQKHLGFSISSFYLGLPALLGGLTQQPALLHLLHLLVERRLLQYLSVLEAAGPLCFSAEQQAPGVTHQLAADRVVALLVQVGVVLAAGRLDGDLNAVQYAQH